MNTIKLSLPAGEARCTNCKSKNKAAILLNDSTTMIVRCCNCGMTTHFTSSIADSATAIFTNYYTDAPICCNHNCGSMYCKYKFQPKMRERKPIPVDESRIVPDINEPHYPGEPRLTSTAEQYSNRTRPSDDLLV